MQSDGERLLLLVNGVGYEILVPAFVQGQLGEPQAGAQLSFFIYYHQTERQPKPILIGFEKEFEKEFFQRFISVEAIGPLKAVKALTLPIAQIAQAIESRDTGVLTALKGIGKRTAEKIVATLSGKMGHLAAEATDAVVVSAAAEIIKRQVIEVLTSQLGHRAAEAKLLVNAALKRNPAINSPEQLFDEVYRETKPNA
jgi:Holliday junction DNA helicase RuvA